MNEFINISNIIKIGQGLFSVYFEVNFPLANLSYETSLDGITWNTPIVLNQTSSPQTITYNNVDFFYVRLSSDYTPTPVQNRIHTSAFTTVFN
jgi:hypothetical protein